MVAKLCSDALSVKSSITLGLFLLAIATHGSQAGRLRLEVDAKAGVRVWDKLGVERVFQTSRAAIEAGVMVGHYPDIDACHQSCMEAEGCGANQECICGCCDLDEAHNDGCFCYFCGPIGGPATLRSEHHFVKPRLPLSTDEEPEQCEGKKTMCGGTFGSVERLESAKDRAERFQKELIAKKKALDNSKRSATELATRIAQMKFAAKKKDEEFSGMSMKVSGLVENIEKLNATVASKNAHIAMLQIQNRSNLKTIADLASRVKEAEGREEDQRIKLEEMMTKNAAFQNAFKGMKTDAEEMGDLCTQRDSNDADNRLANLACMVAAIINDLDPGGEVISPSPSPLAITVDDEVNGKGNETFNATDSNITAQNGSGMGSAMPQSVVEIA